MPEIPTISMSELENNVNIIFECQQKNTELELQKSAMAAENVLMQHLMKAFKIIDRGSNL